MPLVPAICTQCGSPIQVDDSKEAGICPHCGTAFITEKVVNNYVTNHVSNTTVTQNIVKNVYGREKTEAEEYVARGLSFLDIGEYLDAAKCFESAVKREPGKIENHILLYRALTFDFRLYYGGLTGPNMPEITFAINEDKEKYLSLNTVFDRLDKLAAKKDISALQKQYGYTFRKDKNFWLESYHLAQRQKLEADRKNETEEMALLKKFAAFGFRTDFIHNAYYAIEQLFCREDFNEEERRSFFDEYVRDFSDPQTGLLTILTHKIFPLRNGWYDVTVYNGPILFQSGILRNSDQPPKLRLSPANLRNPRNTFYCDALISAKGVFDTGKCCVHARKLVFEEGVTEIVNSIAPSRTEVLFEQVEFPDSLVRIGSYALTPNKSEHNEGYFKFGKGLRRIEEHAFNARESIGFHSDIILPEGLEYIGSCALQFISPYVWVLPASLSEAGSSLFGGSYVIVSLADARKFNFCWNVYQEKSYSLSIDAQWNSSLNEKFVTKRYCYFDVPSNTVYLDKIYYDKGTKSVALDSSDTEKAAFLSWLKQYCTFDETTTKFSDINKSTAAMKPSSAQKKKGCYIATAVYGSYDCPQVWTLRRYRDFSLRRSAPGRLFVKLYYAVSPTLVKLFGKQKWFCSLWKRALDKKIKKLNAQGFANTPYDDQ